MEILAVPVLNVRNITDKDEVIVDISISVCNENESTFVLNAGYAVINLKNEHYIVDTSVAFFTSKDDSKHFSDMVSEHVEQLKDFMRVQRGYTSNVHD